MKYIFGVNIGDHKDNNIIDGQIFLNRSLPYSYCQAIDHCEYMKCNAKIKTSLPVFLEVLKYISFALACFILCPIIETAAEIGIIQAYDNEPLLFYIVAVMILISFILYMVEKSKKKYYTTEEYSQSESYINQVQEKILDFFQIPQDAPLLEVLVFDYKMVNDKLIVKERSNPVGLGSIKYLNLEVYCYVKGGSLILTDLIEEWCIPLYCFTGIRKINKKIYVPQWLKEEPYDKGEYKKYKLIPNQLGYIFFKPYFSIELSYQGEPYELLIPPYELEQFSNLVCLDSRKWLDPSH